MKKAAIYVDAWKVPIFREQLDKAGYSYTVESGLSVATLIVVEYQYIAELQTTVNVAAALSRATSPAKAPQQPKPPKPT